MKNQLKTPKEKNQNRVYKNSNRNRYRNRKSGKGGQKH